MPMANEESTPISTNPKKRTNTIAELSPLANIYNKKALAHSTMTSDSDSSFYGFENLTLYQTSQLNTRLTNIETKFTELETSINYSTAGIRGSLDALEKKIDAELRAKTNNTEMEIMIKDIETRLLNHERETKQHMEKLGNTINGLSEFKQPAQPTMTYADLFKNPIVQTEHANPFIEAQPETRRVLENFSGTDNTSPDISSERQKINEKKLNLIVYNFIETDSNVDDKQKIERMILECLEVTVQTEDNYRIGTYQQGVTRPLLLKFKNIFDKRQVLQRAVNLRLCANAKNVYIKPDLTANQIEESKNLVESLKKRRLEQPEVRWTIHRGQIIQKQ